MKTYNVALRPVHYACISGGKDSLYMLGLILNNPDKYPLDVVYHAELEIDYPWIADAIAQVREQCEKAGIKFVSIKPRRSWYELLEKYNFPTRKSRWCNGMYKMDCAEQMTKWIKEQNCRPVAYIGYCKDEQKRFKYEVGNIQEGQDIVYPLAEEGIEEKVVLEWAKTRPIFNNYYLFNDRQGCMYCPMSSYMNLAYLKVFYPDNYAFMMSEAEKSEARTGVPVFRGDKYDLNYIKNIVATKYVPKIYEIMRKEGITKNEYFSSL